MMIREFVKVLESRLLTNEGRSQNKMQLPVKTNEAAAAAGHRFKSEVFENRLKAFIAVYIIASPLNL